MPDAKSPTEDNSQELIPLPMRIERERKARWIKQSRAEGKKLTDWIVERVERCDPRQESEHDR